MTATADLRAAITGLLRFTEAEEEILLITQGTGHGHPGRWSPSAVVAHNTEFKEQQVRRLRAVLRHEEPPGFPEVDHTDPAVYQRYATPAPAAVAAASRSTTDDLVAALSEVSDDDLTRPDRNPWLRGRQLWLQVLVRGFWHPAGHLGDYYHERAHPERALALNAQAVATARYLGVPDPARGMALYLLACSHARAGQADAAVAELADAVGFNPDLRAHLATDPDLAALRGAGRLASLSG